MKPGDLVELRQQDGIDMVDVGDMDENDFNLGAWPVGTHVLLLGRHPGKHSSRPAVVILIDGKLGWVWDYEIRVILTHSGGDHETR
jgi:hypothetical protein